MAIARPALDLDARLEWLKGHKTYRVRAFHLERRRGLCAKEPVRYEREFPWLCEGDYLTSER